MLLSNLSTCLNNSLFLSSRISACLFVCLTAICLFLTLVFYYYELFRDVHCGSLHCMKGQDKPIVGGDVTHINSQVSMVNMVSPRAIYARNAI